MFCHELCSADNSKKQDEVPTGWGEVPTIVGEAAKAGAIPGEGEPARSGENQVNEITARSVERNRASRTAQHYR
jgi:hypothetical protein